MGKMERKTSGVGIKNSASRAILIWRCGVRDALWIIRNMSQRRDLAGYVSHLPGIVFIATGRMESSSKRVASEKNVQNKETPNIQRAGEERMPKKDGGGGANERRKREGGERSQRKRLLQERGIIQHAVRPGWGINHLRWEERC